MGTALVVFSGCVLFAVVFFTSLAFSVSARSAFFRSLAFSVVVFLPGLLGKLASYAFQLDFWVFTRDFWLFFLPAVLCTIYAALSALAVFAFISRRRLGAAARDI